jgi:GTP pyrophosphokinase
MVGARVNGNMVPIEYQIQNGDQIEIMTSQNSRGPSRDWLNIVQSTQARNKILQWFRTEFKKENVVHGKELLQNYCKAKGIFLKDLLEKPYMESCMRKYGFRDWNSVYAALGHGGLKEGQVINKLQQEYDKDHGRVSDKQILKAIESGKHDYDSKHTKRNKYGSGIVIKGINDLAVRFSKCCNPVPGDEVIGFITRGRGVSVHRTDCVNIIHLSDIERNRLIDAEWNKEAAEQNLGVYPVEIVVHSDNRKGIIFDISKIFTKKGIDVKSMEVRISKDELVTLTIGFEIHGLEQLDEIIHKIQAVKSIIDIERRTNG